MNPIEMLEQACQLAGTQVEVAAATPDVQTPCEKWNAAELVGHMVGALGLNVALMTNTPPKGDAFDPAPLPAADMVSAYQAAVAELVGLVRQPGALDQLVDHAASEVPMPVAQMIMFPTFDMFVHSWDLARATGSEANYPPELLGAVDGFCRQVFAGERNPDIVGDAVAAPADAPAMDVLAAFLGRQP